MKYYKRNYNNHYWEDNQCYWEDNDNQDGTYFSEDSARKRGCVIGNEELEYEKRKHGAALYIRAHFAELMKDEAYRKTYYKLVDEMARSFSFLADNKILSKVSDEERQSISSALDFSIKIEGKKKIERCKEDAEYVVEWVKEGKI